MTETTLTEYPIGERLRRWRQAHGWTIRSAAERAGMSPHGLARLERGLVGADNRFLLAGLATTIGCKMTDITGKPYTPQDRETADVQAAMHDVRIALYEADLTNALDMPVRSAAELAQSVRQAVEYRRNCDYVAAGRLLGPVIRELHTAAFGEHREAAVHQLVLATRVASMMRYAGGPGDTYLAATRCWQAAELTGNPILRALAWHERANAQADSGSYDQVLSWATRAVDELDGLDPSTPDCVALIGALSLLAAVGATGAKQPDVAAGWLVRAEQGAERTGESDTFGLMFGPTSVQLCRLALEVDAGSPRRAVQLSRSIDPTAFHSVSQQVGYYVDMARALARTGADAEAVQLLLTAEDLAPVRVRADPIPRETIRLLKQRAKGATGDRTAAGLYRRMYLSV